MDISIVISGDYQGREIKAAWGGKVYINSKGGEKIMIDSSTVNSYEILEIDDKKSFSSGVARGIVGGAVFGGVGALAGVNSAKTMKTAKIKILFKDGKCSLLKVNKVFYDAIINNLFNLDPKDTLTTNCTSTINQSECIKEESVSELKTKTEATKSNPSEEFKKAKEEFSEAVASAKRDYAKKSRTRKIYTPKQVKLIFLIAVAIAAALSLVMVIVMHSQGDEISTDVFMFIFCTILFSIPTLLGALIFCIPSIKKNRKNK